MTQQAIQEGKELIAEFMGLEVHNGLLRVVDRSNCDLLPGHSIDYDSSWDWIMPVVEKISRYMFEDGDYAYMRTFGMLDDQTGYFMVRINRGGLFIAETLIEACFHAVVEFIKWYNQQKQK